MVETQTSKGSDSSLFLLSIPYTVMKTFQYPGVENVILNKSAWNTIICYGLIFLYILYFTIPWTSIIPRYLN